MSILYVYSVHYFNYFSEVNTSYNFHCRDLLIQQLMREINELKQEVARIKGEVTTLLIGQCLNYVLLSVRIRMHFYEN